MNLAIQVHGAQKKHLLRLIPHIGEASKQGHMPVVAARGRIKLTVHTLTVELLNFDTATYKLCKMNQMI